MSTASEVRAAPVDKRKVRHDRKRQRLLDEAMALVVEDGLEGLTIARLANRVGSSVGALYRYFEGKEEMIVGLQELAIADFRAFMDARLTELEAKLPPSASPSVVALVNLAAAIGSYVQHRDGSPNAHRLVDLFLSAPEAVLSDDEARAIAVRVVEPILGRVGALLHEAVKAGALADGDPAQRTHLAWAFVHGLDHFRKRDRINGANLQVRVLQPIALRTLLMAWGAKPAELDQALTLVG